MDTSAFNKEFYSPQTASKLMWGLLFACTIVSLNLMIEQIGAFADETEMLALSANANIKAKSVLKDIEMAPVRAPEETDRIIVKYKEDNLPPGLTVAAAHANLEKAQGLIKVLTISGINAVVYQVSENDTAREVVDRILAQDKGKGSVEYAEVDMLIAPDFMPDDPLFTSQWHHTNVQTPTAWDAAQGNGVTVAILDTGVNPHEDLSLSPIQAKNFYAGTNDVTDVYGHGSKVAGTAAAVGNNALGVSGIAPMAKILPIKIARDVDGYGSTNAMAQGITYSADNGVKIASISYLSCDSSTVKNAANYMRSKGGVVIVAAGNTGSYPGTAYVASNDTNCVSATDSGDNRTSWSSYGPYVDVAAPGAGIYTTTNSGGYAAVSGTSFSAPLTAGVYALMFSANPALTPSQADSILFTTADDLGEPGWDQYYGWGRVNAAKAVVAAQAAVGTRDITPPSVPQSLRTTTVTANSIALAWNASTDDNSGIGGYNVYQNGTKLTTTSGITYTASNLTPETQYTYTVRAVDVAGNISGDSTTVLGTTFTVPFGISGSSVTKTTTTATINTTLTKPGTVVVKYGKTATTLTSQAQSTTAQTTHAVSLSPLTAASTYYYQVTATDSTGTVVTSAVSSFRTNKATGGGKPLR